MEHPNLTLLSLIGPFLEYGGPTGAIAAYPIVVLGVLLQVLVMAEIGSMYDRLNRLVKKINDTDLL